MESPPHLQEMPENRPRDMNNVPIPSAIQVKEEAIEAQRIAREKAEYERGSPSTGHEDEGHEL